MKTTKFKAISMKLTLMISTLILIFSLLPVQSSAEEITTNHEEITLTESATSENEIIIEDRAAGLILKMLAKKYIKEAAEIYGKQAVKDAIMKSLPKTISGKDLIKKLEKFGFKKVSQTGDHVKMKGPNGKTFPIPLHKELKTGTYQTIKKQIKDSI